MQEALRHDQIVLGKVGELRTRIRLLLAQQWLCVGLTYAALASLLLVAATKFQWWTDAMDYIWVAFLLGGLTGAIFGFTRRITPMVAAQVADERGGLKERLSSGVELSGQQELGEIAEAQLTDAARHARDLRTAEVLPWRAPQQLKWLVAGIALLLAVIYVPELSIFHSQQDRMDREAMKAEGAQIQQVAKAMEKKAAEQKKQGDKNGEILRQVAANMKQLGKDQEKGRISKKQAMLRMNDLQKQLKDAQDKLGSSGNAQKAMDKVADDLMQAAQKAAKEGNAENARQLEQMARNIQSKDLEGAKRQLEELARKMQEGKMSPKEAEDTAQMLQQMAQSMQNSNLGEASQQMKEAAKQLQQAAQAAKQLQQQMANAKTPQQKQQFQQQMQQAMQQGMQMASQKTQQAGGT